MRIVGFIIRICHDARSLERKIRHCRLWYPHNILFCGYWGCLSWTYKAEGESVQSTKVNHECSFTSTTLGLYISFSRAKTNLRFLLNTSFVIYNTILYLSNCTYITDFFCLCKIGGGGVMGRNCIVDHLILEPTVHKTRVICRNEEF